MNFPLPELGEGVYEAELVAWHVKPGDTVKRGQSLAEVLTDKASMELPAPFRGTIGELRVQPGDTMKVGNVILTYEPQASGGRQPAESAATQDADGATREPRRAEVAASSRQRVTTPAASIRAAPSVRQMARELGVDLSTVRGTGPGGRILVKDLSRQIAPATAKPRTAATALDLGKPGTRIKLAGVRKKIAEHMVLAKRTIPHYGYVDECDLTELVRVRESLRETFEKASIKLSYLPFLVKAVVAALKEVPIVNASLDEQAGEIVLHDRYHIGIAVAAPQGLIVPVVHDADRKDIMQLARQIERLSREARAGKAKLEDLRGGTFTITSIGSVGGLISTPIINHPEVGILGVGKIVKRPVYDAAGNLRPAELVYLSFSFDHRVVDGAIGAVFGNAIIRRLLRPAALLLPEATH
jgi:2-oxoisovalerate dehydrogenase E2 component (dihydrolipoyl transacylase)